MANRNKILLLVCALVLWRVPVAHAQTYSILKSFGGPPNSPGGIPYGKMVQGADGTFYGLNTVADNTAGNTAHYGTVFKIRPDGSGFAVIKTFTNDVTEGSGFYGGLWLDGETLYVTRSGGGAMGRGVLLKINTDGSGFAVLKDFGGNDGEHPYGRPLVAGGVVYATTYAGGVNGSPGASAGTIYRVNTDGSNFAVLKHFGDTDGSGPYAGLILSGSNLYGTTAFGGAGYGTIFTVDTNGLGFEVLKSFSSGGSGGFFPYAGLTLAGDKLYGATSQGSTLSGNVFSINLDGSGYKVITSIPSSAGYSPRTEVEIQGDTIFGTTAYDYGGSITGSVFRVFTDGSDFTVLKTLGGGGNSSFLGVNVWGNTIYGLSTMGGDGSVSYSGQGGQIFSMKVDGSNFTVLKHLGGNDGELPYAGLTMVGNTLYGTAHEGGSAGVGSVFQVNSDGSGFAIIQNLGTPVVNDARWPRGELATDDSSNLYGVTTQSSPGYGAIYRVNSSGTTFQVLTNLDGFATTNATGSLPMAGLLRDGNTLYGTAQYGGSLGRGTVFKLNTDGTGLTVLTDFPGSGGSISLGRLVLVGGTLYGTTEFGGDFNHGTMFKVNTDGTGFAVLKSFTSSEEGRPKAGLVASGNTLFGTGNAVVFKLNLDGADFTVLKNFSGDGISWLSALTLSGGSLYGTSRHGGNGGGGVLYKLNRDGSGFEIIHNFAAATGWLPESPVIISGGDISGTTVEGGPGGRGVVYRIKYSEETPIASSQSGNGSAVMNGVNGPTNLVGYYEWQSGQPWQEARLAIQFPVPISLNPASIQSATLRLYYVGDSGAGLTGSVHAHQLLQPWNNIPGAVFPPYSSNFTATVVPATPVNTWISWDVTDVARNWAGNPSSNHGLILVPAPDSPTNNYYKFISRNHVNPALHPVLQLVYRNPTQLVGSVTIAITPPESVTAGAQWRMDGGGWFNSATVISNVLAGNHQIEFKSVLEWATPDPITVRVIGNKVSSNSVAYLANPLVGYNVGQIPTQYIHGVETKVLKVLNPLGGQVDYYGISPNPPGAWNYSSATGIAQYTPATTNDPPFIVTFGYYDGPTLIQQAVTFQPVPYAPPGGAEISFSEPLPPPGDEDTKYVKVSAVTNAPKSFNNQMRATRSIEIVGKTVVFEQGHTNGLYDAFNEANDIETLSIHAETLIVRSPLRLPQTDVTIYARELRFEGNEARFETTPRSITTRPSLTVAGKNGLDAGDITVFIESLTNQPSGLTRFILKGGDGQPGGLGFDGVNGASRATPGGTPRPENTTAFHIDEDLYLLTDPILQIAIYLGDNDFYYPNASGPGNSDEFDSPQAWQPSDGANAVAGGRPGGGGGGGGLNGNLRFVDIAVNVGGNSANQTINSGGEPGTPQPALKQVDHADLYYWPLPPNFPFQGDIWSETHSWTILDTHVSQPGLNIASPSASFLVGSSGAYSASGHPLSWLSPKALSMVFTNAEDAYLRGYFAEAEEVLTDYDSLLTRYQTYPEWQQLSGSWQTEFTNLLAAIQALHQRIASHTVNLGSNITFNATSSGTEPLSYQWLFNGAAIAGATNASLTLSNIGSARQGNYQVVTTNDYGSVTSSVAALNVQLPPGYFQLTTALLGGGAVRLSFIGEPGQSYALDRSASLFPITWVPQRTNAAGPNGSLIFTNAPDPLSFNFWRIRAVP